jgi:Protein of unknown function (DUF2934)
MPRVKDATSPAPRKRVTKSAPTPEQIQTRAYEIYLERHGAPGDPLSDWIQAERELQQPSKKNGRHAKTAVVSI